MLPSYSVIHAALSLNIMSTVILHKRGARDPADLTHSEQRWLHFGLTFSSVPVQIQKFDASSYHSMKNRTTCDFWRSIYRRELKQRSPVSALQSSGRTITVCKFVSLSINTFCVCVCVFVCSWTFFLCKSFTFYLSPRLVFH